MENIVIVGSGLAGLTAAIYAARANLKPIVVSGKAEGGQLMLTTIVENYPGFPEGIMGPELISNMTSQAKKFGAKFVDGDVQNISHNGKTFSVVTEDGQIESKSVIIASGATARTLGLDSEKKYWARGVHTCATCDAAFYGGKDVVCVGGGDSAMEESLFLTKHAKAVTLVHRRDKFRASKIMQDRVLAHDKIKVLMNTTIEDINGTTEKVTSVKLKDTVSHKITKLNTDAVFLAIGHIPSTKFLANLVEADKQGFIITNNTKTKIPGLFACGDVQDPVYKQAVTAAGSGCEAALEAQKYLEGL